jgi:Lon protease-like protein
MSYSTPLFPLQTVLFPGTPLYLHIFEERYKLMVRHCLEKDRRFGVVLLRHGTDVGKTIESYPIGCIARIVHIEPLDEGKMNIVALGEQRFITLNLDQEQDYLVGEIEILNLERTQGDITIKNSLVLGQQVTDYLKLINRVKPGSLDLSRLRLPKDPVALAYLSASLLQIPSSEKQNLLSAEKDSDLIALTQRLYRRETTVNRLLIDVSQQEALRSARLN